MKISDTRIEIREVSVVFNEQKLCDKCNTKIHNSIFDAFKFELEHKSGQVYPEGGDGDLQEMELCHSCAGDCIKLLKENGYRINKSEWES
jgi:hypothetical protein